MQNKKLLWIIPLVLIVVVAVYLGNSQYNKGALYFGGNKSYSTIKSTPKKNIISKPITVSPSIYEETKPAEVTCPAYPYNVAPPTRPTFSVAQGSPSGQVLKQGNDQLLGKFTVLASNNPSDPKGNYLTLREIDINLAQTDVQVTNLKLKRMDTGTITKAFYLYITNGGSELGWTAKRFNFVEQRRAEGNKNYEGEVLKGGESVTYEVYGDVEITAENPKLRLSIAMDRLSAGDDKTGFDYQNRYDVMWGDTLGQLDSVPDIKWLRPVFTSKCAPQGNQNYYFAEPQNTTLYLNAVELSTPQMEAY